MGDKSQYYGKNLRRILQKDKDKSKETREPQLVGEFIHPSPERTQQLIKDATIARFTIARNAGVRNSALAQALFIPSLDELTAHSTTLNFNRREFDSEKTHSIDGHNYKQTGEYAVTTRLTIQLGQLLKYVPTASEEERAQILAEVSNLATPHLMHTLAIVYKFTPEPKTSKNQSIVAIGPRLEDTAEVINNSPLYFTGDNNPQGNPPFKIPKFLLHYFSQCTLPGNASPWSGHVEAFYVSEDYDPTIDVVFAAACLLADPRRTQILTNSQSFLALIPEKLKSNKTYFKSLAKAFQDLLAKANLKYLVSTGFLTPENQDQFITNVSLFLGALNEHNINTLVNQLIAITDKGKSKELKPYDEQLYDLRPDTTWSLTSLHGSEQLKGIQVYYPQALDQLIEYYARLTLLVARNTKNISTLKDVVDFLKGQLRTLKQMHKLITTDSKLFARYEALCKRLTTNLTNLEEIIQGLDEDGREYQLPKGFDEKKDFHFLPFQFRLFRKFSDIQFPVSAYTLAQVPNMRSSVISPVSPHTVSTGIKRENSKRYRHFQLQFCNEHRLIEHLDTAFTPLLIDALNKFNDPATPGLLPKPEEIAKIAIEVFGFNVFEERD